MLPKDGGNGRGNTQSFTLNNIDCLGVASANIHPIGTFTVVVIFLTIILGRTRGVRMQSGNLCT